MQMRTRLLTPPLISWVKRMFGNFACPFWSYVALINHPPLARWQDLSFGPCHRFILSSGHAPVAGPSLWGTPFVPPRHILSRIFVLFFGGVPSTLLSCAFSQGQRLKTTPPDKLICHTCTRRTHSSAPSTTRCRTPVHPTCDARPPFFFLFLVWLLH